MTEDAKAWHRKNRMPKNATFRQRVQWHRAHQKHCACRPIPAKLLELMRKRPDAEAAA